MKTSSKLLIYLLLVSFMTVTCGPDDPLIPPPPPPSPLPVLPDINYTFYTPWDFEEGIYVAGSGLNFDVLVSNVWADGTSQFLTSQQFSSTGSSIFLSGDDQYVAGYEDGWCTFLPCPSFAILWKNGIAQPLEDTDRDSHATSVFVSNADIYVAGDIRSSYGHSIATLWINGIAHGLNDGKFSASATSVFVSNDDVYVAGYEEDHEGSKAKLWKNGIPETLASGSNATSVFVVGADVYVAGYGSRGAIVWKNGIAQPLSNSDHSYAFSVYAIDEDVYVAGSAYARPEKDEPKAMVWKNGEATSLEGDQNAIASSISVSEHNVYVVGRNGDMAVIWKNGIMKSLGQGNAAALYIRK